MLLSGEYNVNDVALACGFSDAFYFSKVFKANKGVSPSSIIPSEPEISRHVPGRHPGEMEAYI
jgi:AraC-like DNA-binding protein